MEANPVNLNMRLQCFYSAVKANLKLDETGLLNGIINTGAKTQLQNT